MCSLSEQKSGSIDHLVYSCPIQTSIGYKEKRDKIKHYIHWKACKYFEILYG